MSKKKSTPTKKAAPAKSGGKGKPEAKKPINKAPAKPAPKKAAAKPVKKSAPKPVKQAAKPAPKKAAAKPVKKSAPKPVKQAAKSAPKKAASAKTPAKPAAKAPAKPAPKPALAPVKAAPAKPAPTPIKAPPPVKAPASKPAPASTAKPVAKPTSKPSPAAAAPVPAAVVSAPEPKPAAPAKSTLKAPPPGPTKSGALFYDSHMHTPLCKHAWGEPEEYAQQAIKAGLKGIIFTCHAPMPNGFWPTVRMSESEFEIYISIVQRAAEAYKNKLHVCLGIESEWFPGQEDYIRTLHERADFDYVLGAVHWQAKEYLAKFESGTIENFRRIYFDNLAKSAESGLYDCLAHPDLVKNYHPDSWCFAIIKNTVSTCLDRIAATGVAMELNTSGLNKSYSEMNPGNEMLRMMAERKIPIVVGSDAHRAQRVGEHFTTALNNLIEAGYQEVCYFQKRQRIDLKISDVLASLKKAADHNA